MGQHLEQQSSALGELTQGMTLVLERQKTSGGIGGHSGSAVVSLGNVLTLLAALAGVGAFLLTAHAFDIGELQTGAIVHDRRVMPLNTQQSMGISKNCQEIARQHPDVRIQCDRPALPGEEFH